MIPSISLNSFKQVEDIKNNFRNIFLNDTVKKVLKVALYVVKFALAVGVIVYGLSQLIAFNPLVVGLGIYIGAESLYHIYKNLTKVKNESNQQFKELNNNLNDAVVIVENAEKAITKQEEIIKDITLIEEKILNKNNEIEDCANQALENNDKGEIQENLNQIKGLVAEQKETIINVMEKTEKISKENNNLITLNKDLKNHIGEAQQNAIKAQQNAQNLYNIGTIVTATATAGAYKVAGPLGAFVAGAVTPNLINFIYSDQNNHTLDDVIVSKPVPEIETEAQNDQTTETSYSFLSIASSIFGLNAQDPLEIPSETSENDPQSPTILI